MWLHLRWCEFDRFIVAVLIINMITLGLETDAIGPDNNTIKDRIPWIMLETVFILIYGLELVYRIYSQRLGWPLAGWNWLDLVVFLIAALDTWGLPFLEVGTEVEVLSLVRIIRLVRLVRVFRLFSLLKSLAFTLMAIKQSMLGLFYVGIVMVGSMYTCAVFVTMVVGESELRLLELGGVPGSDRFGTVPRSMYSLFELLSLDGWHEVGRPLVTAKPAMAIFLCGFIMVFTFGFLNMMVAIVLERTLYQAKRMEQLKTDKMKREAEQKVELMRAAFEATDTNKDGMVDRAEFTAALEAMESADGGEVVLGPLAACLDCMGIPADDVLVLFELLDGDASGQLSFGEFERGCARVLGAGDPLWDISATHALLVSLENDVAALREDVLRVLRPRSASSQVTLTTGLPLLDSNNTSATAGWIMPGQPESHSPTWLD